MADALRILLIAADPEIIRKVGAGLHGPGSPEVELEGADNLATAARRLRAGAHDLALVDLSVGPGDGLQLLSELGGTAPELPVVALAAGPDAPDAAACLAAGARDRIAPQALDGPGLHDRLVNVLARAAASREMRQRSQRMAAGLAAAGELAWHYEAGASQAWMTSSDPDAWRLPGPECTESLDALRARIHPDDRELAVRRIEEAVLGAEPWQVEARVKVQGGVYRWCMLRGRSQFDGQGQLLRATGVVADAQLHHKRTLALQHDLRFMRAVFDSSRVPLAVVDGTGVIGHCNHAWSTLDEAACHAGKSFASGVPFVDPEEQQGRYGDLDTGALARGLKQVLGGVVEQYNLEYGDDRHRWRISISPLLNPGIAGALVSHEEVTAWRQAERETRTRLGGLARDFQALNGPVFRLGSDFEVRAANEAGLALGRAPVLGRDIVQVLPRAHADVVSDGLVALASGGDEAFRDAHPEEGRMTRWCLSVRRDGAGNHRGFLLQAFDVSDLAPPVTAAEEESALEREVAGLRTELLRVTGERERLGELLAEAEERTGKLRGELHGLRAAASDASHAGERLRGELEELHRQLRETQLESEEAKRREARARQAREELVQAIEHDREEHSQALEAERAARQETLAAAAEERERLGRSLAAAERETAELRQSLREVRGRLRDEMEGLLERALGSLDERD
ncbi:MAG: PAS domain-containing protein [Gammaproteobacteria bacterium]|jgi:PAS domain-containing protein